jgi:hypothetical protein
MDLSSWNASPCALPIRRCVSSATRRRTLHRGFSSRMMMLARSELSSSLARTLASNALPLPAGTRPKVSQRLENISGAISQCPLRAFWPIAPILKLACCGYACCTHLAAFGLGPGTSAGRVLTSRLRPTSGRSCSEGDSLYFPHRDGGNESCTSSYRNRGSNITACRRTATS